MNKNYKHVCCNPFLTHKKIITAGLRSMPQEFIEKSDPECGFTKGSFVCTNCFMKLKATGPVSTEKVDIVDSSSNSSEDIASCTMEHKDKEFTVTDEANITLGSLTISPFKMHGIPNHMKGKIVQDKFERAKISLNRKLEDALRINLNDEDKAGPAKLARLDEKKAESDTIFTSDNNLNNMAEKETIDITSSPVKKVHDYKSNSQVKALKNLSNFYNELTLTSRTDSETVDKVSTFSLKFAGENSHCTSLDEGMHPNSPNKTSKKRRKRKTKSSLSSPKFSKAPNGFNRLNNILENSQQKRNESKVSNLFEVAKTGQLPSSFSNIVCRHEELRSAVEKSRQAFSAYKVSTFFCFDSEFIKGFGECLSKTEQSIKSMANVLEKAFAKQVANLATPSVESKVFCSSLAPIETDDKFEKTELCSLTPPGSEVGKNDNRPMLDDSNVSKKRKLTIKGENMGAMERKSIRKLRKCIVSNPVAPKVISDQEFTNETKVRQTKIESLDSDNDSKEGDGEYEVRKIQDYVRRQNGYCYRVSWHGYDSDDDTYEPADHMDGCDEVLAEFFCQRLRERQQITQAEQLRSFVLPSDERVKDLLYNAFERFVHPISKDTRERGIKFVTSTKAPVFKTKEEVQDDILKFLALRDPTLDRYKRFHTSIIEQITFKEIYQEREKQLADLRVWERSMNIISSDPGPLTVENNVDLALPPLDFVYINEYVPGPNIIIPSDPMAGCECKECSALQKGCCASQMGSYFAYNKNGRLRVSLGTPIYECNKACRCPPDCTNRVVQNGRKISLSIFRTSNGRGWGVKALEPIRKDQFVSEYVGEVISSEEAEQRGMKYDTKGCTYLFDLDYNKGDQNPYTVDAVKYGNVSHFINHSCDPNLVVFNVWVNCLDPDLPKLALFAAREIKKGEEITFDYNSGSTRQISIIDKMDGMGEYFPITPTKRQDEEGCTIIPTTEFIRKTPRNRVLNAGKTECRCGAANCRKFFF